MDSALIQNAEDISLLSQITVYESQLVRTFKKDKAEWRAGCQKYMGLYAHVPEVHVQPALLAAAKKSLDV